MRSGLGDNFMLTNNDRGVVLIMALWMLLLLSILGAFALSTSTTEIGIAGNYRNAEAAFNTADAAVEYAETDVAIYSTIGTGSWPPGPPGTTAALGVGANSAETRVDFMATGTGPNNAESSLESQVAKIVSK
jgi:hypothetical protein